MFPADSEVIDVVLDGIVANIDLDDLADSVRAWHGPGNTFPATPLLELGADAFLASRSSRQDRLQLEDLADRLLPEWPVRGNAAHQKRRYALQGAVLIAAGAEPDDTMWWAVDDLWLHALLAVVVLVRAAAERRQLSIADICSELRPN
ncbi:MAG: hypothetical protein JWN99_1509 [Ilumatobacteraceae bacterium]|nr:hypothetical protein [Ilumatobacteraceae bacterium]